MYDFIRENQLNIMLLLCGACGTLAILLVITRFMSKSRKYVLILMETIAFFLLWFDRLAYVYSGNTETIGYVMVRVSNFFVFFLTSAIVLGLNLYIIDLMRNEGGMNTVPLRLKVVSVLSVVGMLFVIVSAFTGWYYYFDESNVYIRGNLFLMSYIIPVLCPIIQFTVIQQYRKLFTRLIYISIALYIFVPIICGIVQIFAYGISIVNMSMVLVSISLYVFAYLDINNEVERAHKIEMNNLLEEKKSMRRLFDQTATAFVTAVEKKDDFTEGHSVRVAEIAKKIAEMSGMDEDECNKVYYTALLHDVGLIGVPDSVIKNEADPEKWDYEAIRQKPVIAREILSNITEYPYLSQGAYFSHERYDGSGYPEGLKGEDIPEIARIVAVADAYDTMSTKKRFREARPEFVVREAFVKGSGAEFDPKYANLMVKLIDSKTGERGTDDLSHIEKELQCKEYRTTVSAGIIIKTNYVHISFECEESKDGEDKFSAPSMILFDSYDGRVHVDKKAIEAYKYLEYGEIWFDKHSIVTAARNIRITDLDGEKPSGESSSYNITAVRSRDHIRMELVGPGFRNEVVVALPDETKDAFIGLTGENCIIKNIIAEKSEEKVNPADMPRIEDAISYIDHMESDIKNVQIDRTRSASTEGIELKDRMSIIFHTMSLPSANLVWHCPYILLFYSENGQVNGPDYREFALVKLNGENEVAGDLAENKFVMKRNDKFPGWEKWKEINKKGLECKVYIKNKGDRITTTTENLGVYIRNTTIVREKTDKVYVALTGDQCAITDIRIH